FLDTIEGFELKSGPNGLTGRASGQSAFPLMRATTGVLFFQMAGIEITPDFGDPKKPDKKAKGIKLSQGALTIDYVRGTMPAPKKPAAPKADTSKPDAKKPPKTGGGDGSGGGKGTGGGGVHGGGEEQK
ncbi:MAG: hypothetical protein JNK04_17610, partial [Myxococcales bacterium]|nr:hypothetical protein [Myxococcales bacterium]